MSNEIVRLSELNKGEVGEIVGYEKSIPSSIRSKILSMGLTRGVRVEMIRPAIFGDPLEFRVRGFNLSLRKNEAQYVLVKKV